ncbi:Heterokaryon incompatibility [Cordyceps militaris]|uniref:Heterokaryon incompatibility n=1 Tax=Cordyceps militaris TaxID=73501 RepID=A0A2H4SSB7_CORMI|nr:Heterokaryon incompatibility [Cordyceps militaris]
MPLCPVCSAIPFRHLPPFPEPQHSQGLTGLQHVHPLYRLREFPRDPRSSSVRHHASAEALREAAAAGCDLCALIQGQLDRIMSEIEGQDEDIRTLYRPSYQPAVDLWLVQRPFGGQGFWVLSESVQSRDEREIIPIAAFGFAVADDKSLADGFHAPLVQQDPRARALGELLKWDSECEQEHECCQAPGAVPRNLLDISRSEAEGVVKLVQLDAESAARYTALSYVRDSSIEGPWTSNHQAETDEILTTSLPRMFQDAVLVTRILGIRYTWIDQLCAPEDAPERQRDSAGFRSVYENAHLTISATGADEMADGLLFSRPLRASVQIPDPGLTGPTYISILPLRKEVLQSYIEMAEEPISRNIWSFQERVLSRRVVHFARDQLFFECLGHFRSEDGRVQEGRCYTTVPRLTSGPDYHREHTVTDRWNLIVRAYGKRQPTAPSDKLRALSNVASAFQQLLDDEYVAGFWKKTLVESLCWQSHRCKPLRDTSAPSWSWASVDGSVDVGFRSRSVRPEATITAIQVTLEDAAQPFGNVTSAAIVLEAPTFPLTLVDQDGAEGRHMYLRTENGHPRGFVAGFDVIDRRHQVSAASIRNSKVFALVLAETQRNVCAIGSCHAAVGVVGVIASPVDASGAAMRRIGSFTTVPDRFGPGDLSSSRTTIVLV